MSPADAVGTAGEEAARLAEALQAWWARRDDRAPDDDRGPDDDERDDDPAGHEDGPCRFCPVCRGLAVAQAMRPEVVHHLLSAVESVAAALRELAREDEAARPHRDRDATGRDQPRTVRIPVDDTTVDEVEDEGDEGDEGDHEAQEGH